MLLTSNLPISHQYTVCVILGLQFGDGYTAKQIGTLPKNIETQCQSGIELWLAVNSTYFLKYASLYLAVSERNGKTKHEVSCGNKLA